MSPLTAELLIEDVIDAEDAPPASDGMSGTDPVHPYQRYRALGGIINEEDHGRTLERAASPELIDLRQSQIRCAIYQATGMANFAKIQLHHSGHHLDPRVLLYVVLRMDTRPPNVEHHHSQMCDQRLLGEAVRMAGDAAALEKLVAAYPNISFEYSSARSG